MRLAGAGTREQANEFLLSYLPRFNAQFAVPAAQEETAYRALPPQLKLEDVLCFKYERVIAADNAVQFGQSRIQLLPGQARRSYARATVEVHEHFDGSLTVHYAGELLASTEAPPEAPKLRARGGRLRVPAPPSAQPQEEPSSEKPSVAAPRPASSTPRDDHYLVIPGWRARSYLARAHLPHALAPASAVG